MKTLTRNLLLVVTSLALVVSASAQLTLSGTSYTQEFDGIESGLPTGWSVRTNATGSSLGEAVAFSGSRKSWGDNAGAFKNVASSTNFLAGTGLSSGSTVATQSNATDRALGIRQTDAFGDPGAAMMLTLANTTGFTNFTLSLNAEMLSVQGRSTTWTVDYRVGNTGNFTSLGTISDPGAFAVAGLSYDFGTALDDQAVPVYIRVAALGVSTGSGSRDTVGIDAFHLDYQAIPEPSSLLLVGAGLAGLLALRRRR